MLNNDLTFLRIESYVYSSYSRRCSQNAEVCPRCTRTCQAMVADRQPIIARNISAKKIVKWRQSLDVFSDFGIEHRTSLNVGRSFDQPSDARACARTDVAPSQGASMSIGMRSVRTRRVSAAGGGGGDRLNGWRATRAPPVCLHNAAPSVKLSAEHLAPAKPLAAARHARPCLGGDRWRTRADWLRSSRASRQHFSYWRHPSRRASPPLQAHSHATTPFAATATPRGSEATGRARLISASDKSVRGARVSCSGARATPDALVREHRHTSNSGDDVMHRRHRARACGIRKRRRMN